MFTNCCVNISHSGDINARTCLRLSLTICYGDVIKQFIVKEPRLFCHGVVSGGGGQYLTSDIHIICSYAQNIMIECGTVGRNFSLITGLLMTTSLSNNTELEQYNTWRNIYPSKSNLVILWIGQMKTAQTNLTHEQRMQIFSILLGLWDWNWNWQWSNDFLKGVCECG